MDDFGKLMKYCDPDALGLTLTPPPAASSAHIRKKVRRKLNRHPMSSLQLRMAAMAAMLCICMLVMPFVLRIGGEIGEAAWEAGGDLLHTLLLMLPEEASLTPPEAEILRYTGFRREAAATYLQFRVETERTGESLLCGDLILRDSGGSVLTRMEQFVINMTAGTTFTSGKEGWSVGVNDGNAYVFELAADASLDEDAWLSLRMEDVMEVQSEALRPFAGILSVGFYVRDYAAKPIETPPKEWGGYVQPLSLAGMSSDGRNYTFTFFVDDADITGVAAMCRSLTLTRADGTALLAYAWELDNRERIGVQLMAGDVLPGTIAEDRIMLQLTVPAGRIVPGEMLTLAIRGLVTVDMPETEVQIFPVEDLLELAFAVEGPSDAPEPVTPASAKVSVIRTKRDADRLTLTLRVEPEGMDALPGMFLLCDGITVTSSASGTLYTHAYGGGQSCTDAKQAMAMVLAGDILTAGEVGGSGFEFSVMLPANRILDGDKLTLTLQNLTAVDTVDGLTGEVHLLAQTLRGDFTVQ